MQDVNPGDADTSVASLWSNPNSIVVHLRCSPGVKTHRVDGDWGGGGGVWGEWGSFWRGNGGMS